MPMRVRHRADPQFWVDLVEQAAVEDVTLVTGARRVRRGDAVTGVTSIAYVTNPDPRFDFLREALK